MARINKQERQEAIERLRESIKEGDTIYCVLRSRAASGMSRVIDLKVIAYDEYYKKPRIWNIGYNAALALGKSYDRDKEGIRIGGAGMDMGFALVYELSFALFGDGYKLQREWI